MRNKTKEFWNRIFSKPCSLCGKPGKPRKEFLEGDSEDEPAILCDECYEEELAIAAGDDAAKYLKEHEESL